jgi:hypothetical protein
MPFDNEIADAIETCQAMLLIFSDRCNDSEYIRREVTVAGDVHKVIIPFRIEDARPKGGLRVRLSDLHWIDAFASRERAIGELVRTLQPFHEQRAAADEHRKSKEAPEPEQAHETLRRRQADGKRITVEKARRAAPIMTDNQGAEGQSQAKHYQRYGEHFSHLGRRVAAIWLHLLQWPLWAGVVLAGVALIVSGIQIIGTPLGDALICGGVAALVLIGLTSSTSLAFYFTGYLECLAGLISLAFGIPINEFTLGNTLINVGVTLLVGGSISIGLVASRPIVRRVIGTIGGVAGCVLIALGAPIIEFSLGDTMIRTGVTALIGGSVLIGLAASRPIVRRVIGCICCVSGFLSIAFGAPIIEFSLGDTLIKSGVTALGGSVLIGLAPSRPLILYVIGCTGCVAGVLLIAFGLSIRDSLLGSTLIETGIIMLVGGFAAIYRTAHIQRPTIVSAGTAAEVRH